MEKSKHWPLVDPVGVVSDVKLVDPRNPDGVPEYIDDMPTEPTKIWDAETQPFVRVTWAEDDLDHKGKDLGGES